MATKFTDVILYWASVHTPNEMSKKYQVNLSNLSGERINYFEDRGLEVRTKDKQPEMGTYITAKSNYPITVVDKNGTLITDLVGNGTVADVVFDIFEGKNKFGPYKGVGVKKIIVKELVSYSEEESEEDYEVL